MEYVDQSADNFSTQMDKKKEKGSKNSPKISTGTDLTKVSMPSKYMMPISMLEVNSRAWIRHSDLLIKANETKTPVERILRVLQYNLSVFNTFEHGKKPFNPVLGEVFKCYIDELGSRTNLVAEQVSHHPPIMALFFWNKEEGIGCTLNNTSKSTFWGTHIKATFEHFTDIFLQKFDEHYITTQIPGIEFGTLRGNMEYKGNLVFHCPTTGYAANIEFHTKSIIGGKRNKITGVITKSEMGKICQLYTIRGHWNEVIEVLDSNGQVIFSWNREKLFSIGIIKVDNSHRNSSALVWKNVSDAIQRGDWNTGDREKARIEEDQRRRIMEMAGKPFQPEYFQWQRNECRYKGLL